MFLFANVDADKETRQCVLGSLLLQTPLLVWWSGYDDPLWTKRDEAARKFCVYKCILDLMEGDFAGMTWHCCLSINGIQGSFGSRFLFIVAGC